MDSPSFDKTLLQPHKRSREDSENVVGSDCKTVKLNDDILNIIKSPSGFSKNKADRFGIEISFDGGRKDSRRKSTLRHEVRSKSKDKLDDSFPRGRPREPKSYSKISKRYK